MEEEIFYEHEGIVVTDQKIASKKQVYLLSDVKGIESRNSTILIFGSIIAGLMTFMFSVSFLGGIVVSGVSFGDRIIALAGFLLSAFVVYFFVSTLMTWTNVYLLTSAKAVSLFRCPKWRAEIFMRAFSNARGGHEGAFKGT